MMLSSATSFVEPDRRQVLVVEMARTDFPAFHVRSCAWSSTTYFSNSRIKPRCFGRVGLVQHLLVEIDFFLVLVIAIVFGEDGVRQILPDIEQRIDHALTIGFEDDVEIAAAYRLEPE